MVFLLTLQRNAIDFGKVGQQNRLPLAALVALFLLEKQ
jgi:hypothetical protein